MQKISSIHKFILKVQQIIKSHIFWFVKNYFSLSVLVFYYVQFIISWMKVFNEPMFWEKLLQLSWKANSNLLITTAYYLNSISSDHDSTQKNTLHNLFCILQLKSLLNKKKAMSIKLNAMTVKQALVNSDIHWNHEWTYIMWDIW